MFDDLRYNKPRVREKKEKTTCTPSQCQNEKTNQHSEIWMKSTTAIFFFIIDSLLAFSIPPPVRD